MNRTLLTALLLASSQAPLGSTLIAVAIPSIAQGLQTDTVQVTTLLVVSYLVTTVLFQGPGGRLSDLAGHSYTLWLGIGLFALGSIAGLVSPNLVLLSFSRSVTAVGGALVVPATMALMRELVASERRGRVFGTFGAVMALSAAIGPVVGGEIVGLFGWRAIFLASLPFLATAAVLLRLQPPPQRPATAAQTGNFLRSIDVLGLVVFGIALGLLVASARADGTARPAMLTAGLLAGAGFVIRQSRSLNPTLDVRLLLNPVMAGATAIMALQNFAMYGLLFQLPVFFEHFRGAPPRIVGYGLFSMMIGMVIASPLGGRGTDRLGSRMAGAIGAAVLSAGSLLLLRLPLFATPGDAVPYLLVFGFGMGLSSAPAQSSAMVAVPPSQAGMAAGLSSTMRYLGGIATIGVQAAVLGTDSSVSLFQHETLVALYCTAALLSLAATSLLPPKGAPQT